MSKGDRKKGRENKKPKQNKLSSGSKTAYAQSMAAKNEPTPFGKKK